jgi:hypothetical protein
MPDRDLSNLQFAALAVLWTQPSSGVPNTFFTNKLHVDLDYKSREGLRKDGLIEVVQEKKGRPIQAIKLTSAGRERLREEAGREPHGRPSTGDRVIRGLVSAFGDHFDDSLNLPELLGRAATPKPVPAEPVSTSIDVADMQMRIRKAYSTLVRSTGDWVNLLDLRNALEPADRSEVDGALIHLNRDPDVHIVPKSDQKSLTPEQRAAAVVIGNQDRHQIAIGAR